MPVVLPQCTETSLGFKMLSNLGFRIEMQFFKKVMRCLMFHHQLFYFDTISSSKLISDSLLPTPLRGGEGSVFAYVPDLYSRIY